MIRTMDSLAVEHGVPPMQAQGGKRRMGGAMPVCSASRFAGGNAGSPLWKPRALSRASDDLAHPAGERGASAVSGGISPALRGRLRVVPARRHHLRAVLANLRPSDCHELQYATGRSARAAAARAFALSPLRWAVLRGATCIALGGGRPYAEHPGVAAVWLYGTPQLDAEHRALVRLAPLFAAQLRRVWPCLVNVVPAFTLAARPGMARWLERCGLTVCPEQPLGPAGRMLHPVIGKRELLHRSIRTCVIPPVTDERSFFRMRRDRGLAKHSAHQKMEVVPCAVK